jgi:PHD/YefM family antitoxin component YafN of YafNO toxin-antitoxin module
VTNLQYIIDASGHKTAVVLPIEEYEEMIEDLHLGEAYRASQDEPKRDFLELVEEMRRDGEIDV